MNKKSLILALVFWMGVLGCRPVSVRSPTSAPPVTCDQIIDAKLDTAPLGQIHGEAAMRWVHENYPGATLDTPGQVYIYWDAESRGYNARFASSVEQSFVTYRLSSSVQPMISEVIACLGNPASYFVGRTPGPETSVTRFIMLYPDRGLLVAHSSLASDGQLSLKTLRLDGVAFRRTSSIELLASSIVSEEYAKIVAKSARPWPESLDNLKLE